MNFDVYNTHMEIYPYTKDDYPVIEDMYMAEAKFTGNLYACGFMIEDGKLYLPRGTSISKIEQIIGVEANIIKESDPAEKMSVRHWNIFDPRDKLQEDSISFLEEGGHQLGLNLNTGIGKTFCVAYASSELALKTIIITPNEGIKQQWIATYNKKFEYRPKHLMNIAGSNIIEAIMEDAVEEADVYFVNHQTLRSYLSQTNGYQLHQFFKKLKVGIKVYDESHMEFANILLIDFFTNTERTWYLTATFDRSDKSESACFKRAFQSVVTFGKMQSEEVTRKHIIYHTVNINSRISTKDRAWLMGHPGFTGVKYGKYAFFTDPNDSVYKTILAVLKKTENLEGKTLIFVPIIDAVDEITKKLRKDFPQKSVAAYHSRISKEDKDAAEKKDIIVSTIKSCGTGRDIPGLRTIICAEPVASKVVIEQTMGRLRPYAPDKDTFYFDIVDRCIPPINWWYRGRYKKIETIMKEGVVLEM